MTSDVYLTRTGSFLPNDAVINDDMEDFLGKIGESESRSRWFVLRNNGIVSRHYALTRDGTITHSNADLVVEALRNELDEEDISTVDLLACGTSSPDQMIPSHGLMVHGLLPELGSIEVVSPAGVCCSGMHALKYTYLSVASGNSRKAIATGSELVSPGLVAHCFEKEYQNLLDVEDDPSIAFEKDFLRWMLSDGAGFFLVEREPDQDRLSFKIDWIECVSFANTMEPCMFQGAQKINGTLKGYKEYTPLEMADESVMTVKQDAKLLLKHITRLGALGWKQACERRDFDHREIRYMLPHLSSMFFEDGLLEQLSENGIPFERERLFTNLKSKGNTGSASIYVMLDELVRTKPLEAGEKVFLVIPESARFSYVYVLLTVC